MAINYGGVKYQVWEVVINGQHHGPFWAYNDARAYVTKMTEVSGPDANGHTVYVVSNATWQISRHQID